VHATDQVSVRVEDLALIERAMTGLREDPPDTLGGDLVASAEDLSTGPGGLPPTDGLRYRTSGGVRVVVRPSGTEPKLKCYLEAVVPLAPDAGRGELAKARAEAAARLARVGADLTAALDLR